MSHLHATNLGGLERWFDEGRARARLAAARGAFRALPRLAGSLLEVAACDLKPAPIPHFFSTRLTQIEPGLNDDLLELYGRAGQALANRFAFFNSPQAFDEGIDWEPPQSPAWRAELHACDYVFDLACTYRISREPAYARHLRYLTADWIAGNPPAAGTGWQPHILARRIRNWMLSADFARSDGERDAEFQNLICKSLAMQAAFLMGNASSLLSPHARLDAACALLGASRFFSGPGSRTARQAGFDLLARALTATPPEPWPHARLGRARALMEWNLPGAGDADAEFLAGSLWAALEELQSLLMPEGGLPLLGPEARLAPDELSDLAALAAVKFSSPAWKALAGKFGILPYLYLGDAGRQRFEALEEADWAPQDSVSPEAEVLRVAGPQNSALVIAARLPASPGEHEDFSSYELTLHNHRVVVDSGGFSPEEREYFPRARAHNLLLVDGREPRWPQGGAVTRDFEPQPAGGARLRMADPGFESLGVRHTRAWFRMQNNAWCILDWLQGEGTHRCTSLMHFYPTFEVVPESDHIRVHSRARTVLVIPVGAARPAATVTRGDHPEFPGWFAPEFGVRFPSAVLALHWAGIQLPWLGGVLVASEPQGLFRPGETAPAEGRLSLEFCGKTYDLRMT